MLVASLVLMPASGTSAGALQVQSVRLWAAPDSTRVVFDVSGPVEHRLFTLKNPDRLVIDLPNAGIDSKVSKAQTRGGIVNSLRSGPRNKKDLRLVLDLKQPVRAKSQLGYLPERLPLYPELRVDEYLRYCARLHRVARRRVRAAVDEAKQRCGLGGVGRRLIGNLSKGFQQRVGIAQAILHNPAVVILDEPTVGLDPNQIRDIRSLIRELGESHGIILSTHILPEVQATCTRVQIIHQGRLVFAQTIQELEQRLTSHVLLLETRQPLDATGLATVPGIDDVELLGASRARLHFTDSNPADAVAAYVASAGLGLVELALDRQTLEQVFVELTCSDRPDTVEHAA